MAKQKPIDLSVFDEAVKSSPTKKIDLSVFDEVVKAPSAEKKNLIQPVAPTGSKPSPTGSKPSQTQEDTKFAIQESVNKFRGGGTKGYFLDGVDGGNDQTVGTSVTPSVLLSDEQKQQAEKNRIGKRFETTLLNIPTEFGKVGQFMRSAKKVKDTLPQIPTIKPDTGGMVVIPDGSKIGDSLRKGDTLQDELTDKLTGKKTALQKQIENAENAYRTYQGDEMADQARVQSGKEPMQFEAGYENIAPLMSGLQGTVSSIYKIPRYIYNVFAIPQNLIADLGNIPGLQANYENVSKGTFNPLAYLEYAGDYTKGQEEKWQSRQRQYDEGVFDQLSNGDFGGAGLQIYDNVIGSAPSIAAMFLSGGVANAAKLGSISSKIATALPFASAQNQALLENENIPEWLKPVNAAFNGLSEILLEGKFGTTAILKGATRIVAEQGVDVAAKSIKDLVYNYIKKALSKVQPVTDVVSNAAEEMATTLSQNFIAIATGEDPNRGIMDGVADAGIVGGSQGLGASAIRKGFDIITNKKSKDKVEKLSKQRDDIVNDLDNEVIPDSVKEQLEVKLEAITEELNNTLDENRNEIKNLPEESKLEVAELADKIETIKESLQNKTISETTKAILEQDLKDAQAELDAKFKLDKPTFDTEEQLIEEIRAAEKEFNETGDAAEYQLKINDLNQRLENLVPAPAEAVVAPTEEEVSVTEIPAEISQLEDDEIVVLRVKNLDEIPEQFRERAKLSPLTEVKTRKKILGLPIGKKGTQLIGGGYTYTLTGKEAKDYAIQEQTAGQVPVLTEAPVGEEVEQGKPQPKVEGVTEEGAKAEEVVSIGKDVEVGAKPKPIDEQGILASEKWIKDLYSLPELTRIQDKNGNVYDIKNAKIRKLTLDKEGNVVDAEVIHIDRNIYKKGTYSNPEFFNEGYKVLSEQSPTIQEQTPAQQVEQLRAEEQAELNEAIPNAEQYITDGKVDRNKIENVKDLRKFDEIYDKYDKLITPLLPKKETKGEEVKEYVTDRNEEPITVYHGSKGLDEIETFDFDKSKEFRPSTQKELGFHFGTSENSRAIENTKGKKPSKYKIKATRVLRLDDEADALMPLQRNNFTTFIDLLPTEVKDRIKGDKNEYARIKRDFDVDAVREALISEGYDVLEYRNYLEDGGNINYIVLDPDNIEKVKSEEVTPAKTDILPKYKKKSIAEWFNKGLNATSIFEGGEIHPEDATKRAAWRSMGSSEFIKLLGGEEIGGETKKGGYFGDNPAIASAQKGEGKYLVEFGGKRVEFETTVVKVSSKDITGVWKYENGSWNKLSKEAVEDLIPKAQTEKEAKAEQAPAKPKAEPKAKAKIATIDKFKEAIDLFYDISATEGGAKKRSLTAKRRTFMEQNPTIKYIDDNWKNISKQLEDKGLITKKGNCP